MAHSPPPVPPEQRSLDPTPQDSNTEAARTVAGETEGLKDPRDEVTSVQDGQPGDAGINTSKQGRYGDVKQNTTHQGLQQDR